MAQTTPAFQPMAALPLRQVNETDMADAWQAIHQDLTGWMNQTADQRTEATEHMNVHLRIFQQWVNHEVVPAINNANQTLHGQIVAVENLINQAPAAAAAGGAAGGAAAQNITLAQRVKAGKPAFFTGNQKNGPNYREWLTALMLYMGPEPRTDREKITIALSFLKGDAYNSMNEYNVKIQRGEWTQLGTWADFIGRLRSQYDHMNTERSARKELRKLSEDKHLFAKDFVKFAEKFRTLATMSGLPDDEIKKLLLEAADKDYRYHDNNRKDDPTYAAHTWLERLDNWIGVFKAINPDKSIHPILGGGTGRRDDDNDDDAMDTSAAKATRAKKIAITEKKKKYCSRCKKTTHNTVDCYFDPSNASK